MDTDSFIVYIKTDNIYKDVWGDVEGRFDTSNYALGRPLPKGKEQKGCWCNKVWIGWKNHEQICWIKKKNLYLLNRWG